MMEASDLYTLVAFMYISRSTPKPLAALIGFALLTVAMFFL